MSQQTSYAFNMPLAVEGKIADSEFNLKEGTWVATEAIAFGRGVTKVIGEDDQIQLPDGTDNTFHGVSIMHQNDEQSLSGNTNYDINEPINVMRKGKIWVHVEEAVDPDTDSPFFRYAAGSETVLGRFRTDADTATAAAVPNARFVTSTSGAGLAVLEINNP